MHWSPLCTLGAALTTATAENKANACMGGWHWHHCWLKRTLLLMTVRACMLVHAPACCQAPLTRVLVGVPGAPGALYADSCHGGAPEAVRYTVGLAVCLCSALQQPNQHMRQMRACCGCPEQMGGVVVMPGRMQVCTQRPHQCQPTLRSSSSSSCICLSRAWRRACRGGNLSSWLHGWPKRPRCPAATRVQTPHAPTSMSILKW